MVADALNDPAVQQAMEDGMAAGTGVMRNSAWANPDPEQIETYGLIAQYALDEASHAVEEIETPEAPPPPEPPEPPGA